MSNDLTFCVLRRPPKWPTCFVIDQDIVLAELLTSHKDWIVTYHEHDSLLENRPEEDLSEEDRAAAWEEYEKEKQGLYNYSQRHTVNHYHTVNRPPQHPRVQIHGKNSSIVNTLNTGNTVNHPYGKTLSINQHTNDTIHGETYTVLPHVVLW